MSVPAEEDRPLRAQQLVQAAVNAFDSSTDSCPEVAACLFAAHQWFLDSTQLLAHFVAMLQETKDKSTRKRVCMAVAAWIELFPMHFDGQLQLCSLVVRLRAIADDVPEDVKIRLDVSDLPSYAWLRTVSVRLPVARQVSLSFEQWSPEDISTSLSHIDFKMLSRISITELKKYVKTGCLSSTPHLERSISVFNNLTNWVQCMILSKATPKDRGDILRKFVDVASYLLELNNFNTLMAVVGGITHSNVSRLSKTMGTLSSNTKNTLNRLSQLLSIDNNFGEYRRTLSAIEHNFKMPIIGIHLKDLVALNCCSDYDKTGAISIRHLSKLASILSQFLVYHHRPLKLPDANLDLVNTLRVSLDIRYNEDDIYELSLRREPRTFIGFESPARSVVFAEWASGVTSVPDPETVKIHVTAMVEAVFKHYDNDRDGYISRAEFCQISGNFPFIDPFSNIDLDRDGQISKEELKTYFIKANNDMVAFRMGFKHDFHETTFLTPTSCSHCGKLLWGLIRQGWKCKDCGLAVHGYCKENAVAECRRSKTPATLSEWFNSKSRNSSFRERSFNTKNSGPRTRAISAATPEMADKDLTLKLSTKNYEIGSPRPQSESNEIYDFSKIRAGMTPDEEPVAALACEEVFDDAESCENAETTSILSKFYHKNGCLYQGHSAGSFFQIVDSLSVRIYCFLDFCRSE